MNQNPTEFTLRPATKDDIDFIFYLRSKTMKPVFENTLGWNEINELEKATDNLEHAQIIMVDQKSIGVIKVIPKTTEFLLHQIQILPESQKSGIGTKLINQTVAQAGKTGKPVTLYVVKDTPAMHLYNCLGFTVEEDFQFNCKMSKKAENSPKPKL